MKQQIITLLKIVVKTAIKLLVSGIALYFVFKKTDVKYLMSILHRTNVWYIILAFIFYNLSQLVSTWRLSAFLKVIDINETYCFNLKLYYKGMFYNLFLPGGIGGDGVKGYILTNRYTKPVKQVISVLFLDRLSGFAGLLFLSIVSLILSQFKIELSGRSIVLIFGLLVLYPAYYLFIAVFFKSYYVIFPKMVFRGLIVNLVLSVSVLMLLLSLGIHQHLVEYMAVFYLADMALLFPFTIGGAGARELVFLNAPIFFAIDTNTGVVLSLLLFIIGVLSSMAGIFVKISSKQK